MSASFNLRVGVLSKHFVGKKSLYQRLVKNVQKAFYEGSNGDISLRIEPSPMDLTGWGRTELTNGQLHRALRNVVGRQKGPNIDNLGLLVADFYKPRRNFFGYMFDKEFRPNSNLSKNKAAREGAAVFLGGMLLGRKKEHLSRELIFTAIHELGHCFNLQHGDDHSFMFRSATLEEPIPQSRWKFSPKSQRLLSKCSSSVHIAPGGSDFGDLGPYSTANTTNNDLAELPIEIKITSTQSHAHFYEPMELDIAVSLRHGCDEFKLPDQLDPSYHSFQIMIEDPYGERKRYRSPKHFCSTSDKLSLLPNQPFERDISIFGQSGGYTFEKPGIHKIWTIIDHPGSRPINSNILEVEILGLDGKEPTAADVLLSPEVASLCYYRELDPELANLGRTQLAELAEKLASVGNASYALGRALVETPDVFWKEKDELALKTLKSAILHEHLSDRRKEKAEALIRLVEERGT